ncbi:hypothetical protein QR680_008229 [Steinernema hermaphroditum]|uniref:CCHC-type domain-containing protein n=1 Tax=Steinernema hermaphroditum TaxID=289476 RepID=A0AA39M6P1_9BILA|nr:hypothetical protein QR680_008229 [Steinernema hermaphroditum]
MGMELECIYDCDRLLNSFGTSENGARPIARPLHPLSEQLSEKMSDQVESPQGSEKFDHLFALMEKVAEKVDTLEAKQQQAAVKEKPLKSTRLDVQVQLNAEWINRLNQLAAEVGENQSLSALIEDMKARNMLLRKGDAQPSFFKFFEDRQSAHPEMSLAQCVQEALDKFTEIEAARPAQLPSATRKRPFPRSGGGGARTSVAFNYRDNQIASLAAQVQQLQQQTQYAIGGYGAPQQFARRPAQSMCYNCKGYGHLAKQCPQGASSSRQ